MECKGNPIDLWYVLLVAEMVLTKIRKVVRKACTE